MSGSLRSISASTGVAFLLVTIRVNSGGVPVRTSPDVMGNLDAPYKHFVHSSCCRTPRDHSTPLHCNCRYIPDDELVAHPDISGRPTRDDALRHRADSDRGI